MLLKEFKHDFHEQLDALFGKEEVESFFFILTEYLHNLRRVDVILNPNFEISDTDCQKWNAIILDLKTEKPIQYITGEAWFYGLRFEVNQHTLIPRPETEELVDWILSNQQMNVSRNQPRILDIGTGTGCIPISLQKNLPNANVSAIDVSEEALQVAKRNANSNEVTVSFILKNILETENLEQQYDVIVSNPPYVRNLEKEEISKNVLAYEPHLALFVEDNDALLFYRKIAQLAKKNLTPNGQLFFEINQYLGNETVALLQQLGFQNIELKKDFKGNDRMIKCSF
jgi:release factor glutamine methyltransferase